MFSDKKFMVKDHIFSHKNIWFHKIVNFCCKITKIFEIVTFVEFLCSKIKNSFR